MKLQLSISAMSASAVAPETEYSWNTYNSAASFGLLFRGKEVLISKDAQFGLRDGSKGAARLIMRGEPTKVITVTPEERTVLLARATPVATKGGRKAKVQGVVPEFAPTATWANDIAPALATAVQELAASTLPTADLIAYLESTSRGIKSFAEDKATAQTAKKLVEQIGKAKASKGVVNARTEGGALAAIILNSSPEWKRIKTGRVKTKKMADAYDTHQDFYVAAAHLKLAKALLDGNMRTLKSLVSNMDTSIRESVPKKVWDPIRLMLAQARVRAK